MVGSISSPATGLGHRTLSLGVVVALAVGCGSASATATLASVQPIASSNLETTASPAPSSTAPASVEPSAGKSEAVAASDSPAPSLRTYPPLPAIAVVASGHFLVESSPTSGPVVEAFTRGTTFRLAFRFDGGDVTGRGSRPTVHKDYIDCRFTFKSSLTFSGTFDPLTRQLTGFVTTLEPVDAVPTKPEYSEQCKEKSGTGTGTGQFVGQVYADGKRLSGYVLVQGVGKHPFAATIAPTR
jgi:hypothetical protein